MATPGALLLPIGLQKSEGRMVEILRIDIGEYAGDTR
jgi:hypothetical protein